MTVVVTSVTIVPNSSCSNSVRVEDCRVSPSSYEGRVSKPGVSDDELEGNGVPWAFTGINFQMNQGRTSVAVQSPT